MRNRVVQTKMRTDHKAVVLPGATKWFLVCLMQEACDCGHVPIDVSYLANNVYAEASQTEETVRQWTNELVQKGFITRLEDSTASGMVCGYITDWSNKNGFTFQYIDKTKAQKWCWLSKEVSQDEERVPGNARSDRPGRNDGRSDDGSRVPVRRGGRKRQDDSGAASERTPSRPTSDPERKPLRKFRGGKLTESRVKKLVEDARERSVRRSLALSRHSPYDDTREATKTPQNRSEGVSRPSPKEAPLPTTAPDPMDVLHLSVPEAMQFLKAELWDVETYRRWNDARGQQKKMNYERSWTEAIQTRPPRAVRTFRK